MDEEIENLFGSAEVLESSERDLQKMLRARGISFGDGLLPTYAHAYVLPEERVARWAGEAERLIEATEQIARRLVDDEALYTSLGLSRAALDLVRVDPGYKRICVLCRPDGIPTGADVKFVEVNCDTPAMMMFIDIVAECLMELPVFAALRGRVRAPKATDRLLETLLDCYREWGGTGQASIAITDWEGQKTRYEHMRLAEHFERRGCPTIVCDPRAFSLRDGKLHVQDRRIDLVYRRAVTSELIDRQSEVEPLLAAYRSGSICMVNPLRSHIAGAKSVLSMLAQDGLCVPRSVLLDSAEARDMVRASPRRWVLKKSESHGGESVVLPDVANDEAWQAALKASEQTPWIAQEVLEVPRLVMSTVEHGALKKTEKYYNWNPFLFGGKYAGGLVRVSSTPLINITLGGGLLPTFSR